nr:tetratricopeptide repeat protein [Bacteroidota bacterium]
GYAYLQNEEFEDAIRVFQENVKRYPESSNVYDSLGEAYEKNKQFKDALKSYKKAVKIGSREMSHNLVIYTTNMERMKENISE